MQVNHDIIKPQPLQGTGERYIPEMMKGVIELEHVHRYLLAAKLVQGKRVLDIASGEGYGSDMLASVANHVTGVDISEDAIFHAKSKYQRNNLEFQIGSAADIPLKSNTIDVVVSFETIEHHDKHEEMMSEVKRVLVPGGMLIISSPNKYYCSIVPNYVNHYHVKELFTDEFEQLLKNYFGNVQIFGQRVVFGSLVISQSAQNFSFESLKNEKEENCLSMPVYDVAIASDSALPKLPSSLFESPIKGADAATYLNKQIILLIQAVAECEEQITNLNQAVTDRDTHIRNYGVLLAEREEQLDKLNQIVAVRDGHISYLQGREAELQALSNEFRQAIKEIQSSRSWRITKPLREMSLWIRRFVRLVRLFQNYRRIYPGINGLRRLLKRSIEAIRKGGINNLRSSIATHARSHTNLIQATVSSSIVLEDITNNEVKLPNDVAVHAHIYYPDLAPEIRDYLANIPVKYHCYVTTDTPEKAKLIKATFSDMKNIRTLDVRVVENRGRDLAPMIVGLGKELVRHDVVLHIHSKRSPHNPELRGWRRYLMTSLLGSAQRVTAILHYFAQNERLGILYPQIYRPVIPFMRIGGNANLMAELLSRAGKDKAEFERINQADFPAGGMFWLRGKAIEPLVKMGLSLQDFDTEAGQDDATLAHAIERLFPYFSVDSGLYPQSYLPKQLSSSQPGASPLGLLNEYCIQGLVVSPVIIFDHNIGGGANRYSRELMSDILCKESAVLRIYHANECWFVEWIAVDDGLIFASSSEAELFEMLAKVGCKNIIVNSLYGYPDVDDISHRIVNLTKQLDAFLDFKVHDFYAICPSQHLLDFKERYCGVPSNHDICHECLKKNPAVYWASSRTVDIDEWRLSYTRLFDASDAISVFDVSTIEILRKGFQIGNAKIKVTPHSDGYFKCNSSVDLSSQLHIGVLGTLTTIKGASVVNALAEHLVNQGLGISFTVIGQSLVPTSSRIKVHGPYQNKNLPEIVRRTGISVFLMPTIVPETFSYTISEAMKMGLPIVAFDIGAQGSRVKRYEHGKVIPLGSSPKEILAAIQSVHKAAKELIK